MINPTPKVNCQFGAPMGRPKYGNSGSIPSTSFSLRRIPINGGGYDRGGAYWGIGQPLYFYVAYETAQVEYGPCEYCDQFPCETAGRDCRWTANGKHTHKTREEETEISDYIRADSREHAKEKITRLFPAATFKR